MNTLIPKESLGELVAEQLRKNIWNREIEFGERLIEKDLSDNFNVSRNTIRDALKILENEEMIVIQPRKGTYVSQFSKKDWHEIIELRLLVESFAFLRAIAFLRESDIKYLNNLLIDMKKIVDDTDKKNWNELFDLDMKFHNYVVQLSDNSRIIKLYDSIQVQIRTFLIYLDNYYSSQQSFYQEQKDLFDALLTKNPKIIEKKIRTHIEFVEGQYIHNIS